MPHSYPPPTALSGEVDRVISLYRDQYGVELPFHEAKKLLEGVAQFIYLTEMDQELAEAGMVRDPVIGGFSIADDDPPSSIA